MSSHQSFSTYFISSFVAFLALISCWGSSQARPTAELESMGSFGALDLLFARSPEPLNNEIMASQGSRKPNLSNCRGSRCIQSGDDDEDNRFRAEESEAEEDEVADGDPHDADVESQFHDFPEKKVKVDAEMKEHPDAGTPDDIVCKSDQTRCSGECCESHEHCAQMAFMWQEFGRPYQTCCPKGKKADVDGKCCQEENLIHDLCVANVVHMD